MLVAGRGLDMRRFFSFSSQSTHKTIPPFVTCQQTRDQLHKFVNSHKLVYGGLHKPRTLTHSTGDFRRVTGYTRR